ncbi:hypothetical protein F5X96DRAFT_626001 [Biscogniauxia mediterranea]|nr:hypothetical protein F5X96DRAFT_626001 [Biscogniauxia mediterranea]
MAFTASDICKIIFAVLLPPLGVFLERGCGADLCINILLTILGYIPGIIHALYVILCSHLDHQTCSSLYTNVFAQLHHPEVLDVGDKDTLFLSPLTIETLQLCRNPKSANMMGAIITRKKTITSIIYKKKKRENSVIDKRTFEARRTERRTCLRSDGAGVMA